MSEQTLDKWSQLDHGKTAHWWLGAEGTACGRDFRSDIRHADDAAMSVCRKCAAHPDATPFAEQSCSPTCAPHLSQHCSPECEATTTPVPTPAHPSEEADRG